MNKYATIICARNEEKYLAKCLDSVLDQELKSSLILVINDGSIDKTPDIVKKYSKSNNQVKLVNLDFPRHKIKGINQVRALKIGISLIHEPINFLISVDADVRIPPQYANEIISHMTQNPNTGLASGYPSGENQKIKDQIINGARIYRWEIIGKIPIPEIPGFDSYLKFKIIQLGYEIRLLDLKYDMVRPVGGSCGARRHYFWGMSSKYLCQPISIALIKSFNYSLRGRPFLLAGLIYFLGYLVHQLTPNNIIEPEYRTWANQYFRNLFIQIIRGAVNL